MSAGTNRRAKKGTRTPCDLTDHRRAPSSSWVRRQARWPGTSDRTAASTGPCSPAHATRRRGSRSRGPDFTVDACRGGPALRTANSISRGGGASLSTPRTRRVSAWRPGGAGGARLRGPWKGHDRPNFGRPRAGPRRRRRNAEDSRGVSFARGSASLRLQQVKSICLSRNGPRALSGDATDSHAGFVYTTPSNTILRPTRELRRQAPVTQAIPTHPWP